MCQVSIANSSHCLLVSSTPPFQGAKVVSSNPTHPRSLMSVFRPVGSVERSRQTTSCKHARVSVSSIRAIRLHKKISIVLSIASTKYLPRL